MVDIATQRLNMVESQVRPSDVVDRRIPAAMSQIPREEFVPEALRAIAYMDDHVSLDATAAAPRCLLAPRVLAKMIQHLELADTDLVLDIGCATGYSTAVLAHIAQTVVGLESDHALAEQAATALDRVGIDNAAVVEGALAEGHATEGPYDAILLNGTVDQVPPALLDQLKDGGRLVTIMAQSGYGRAMQWRRLDATFDAVWLFDATAPALPGFAHKREFVF